MFDPEIFIRKYITGRPESLFAKDMQKHRKSLFQEIQGHSVLVIGGAGTIGSSFIKALLPFLPARLVVVDFNENGLTELTRDLRSTPGLYVPDIYFTYPVNFGDPLFYKILKAHGPFDIVANFAAHKHVRSEKDIYSIEAMLRNNLFYNDKLLNYLLKNTPKHFFCVSTDKATKPVNVMGASKRLMEDMLLAYSTSMKITSARFANVAFSNGSLLAGFVERVVKRQPLSAPLALKRYFVSPQESGEICLIATILGQTGEIFFPRLDADDMRDFASIALDFLKYQGYIPYQCQSEEEAREFFLKSPDNKQVYPVYFFESDTSGEKIYEEFISGNEEINWEQFESLAVIKAVPSRSVSEVKEMIGEFESAWQTAASDKASLVKIIESYLPEFQHKETGISLDQKM